MNTDFVRTLFEYQIGEDRRLWDAVISPLDNSLFAIDTGYSWGSLQRECVHVVDTMHAYLERINGIKQVTKAFKLEDPDKAQVREMWDAVEAKWKSYMAALDDLEFHRRVDIVYRETEMTAPVWNIVLQVFNHNTLHRAEMLQMVAVLREPVDFSLGFAQYCLRNRV